MNKRVPVMALIVASACALVMFLPAASPVSAGPTSYRFAVGGDDHYGDTAGSGANMWGNTSIAYMSALQRNGIQRFFEVGDLTKEQGPRAYSELAEIYNNSGIPYNITLGNHDFGYLSFGCQPILDYYGGPYALAVDSIVFILMDATTMTDFNESTMSWLDSTLTAHQDEICFIMMHIMHKTLGYPEVEMNDASFINLVESHADHIGAVIAGHIHEYKTPNMYDVNGVHYTYSGTVGSDYAPMNPDGIFSYLTVEMEETVKGWNLHLYRKNINTDAIIAGTEDYYAVEWGDHAVEEHPASSAALEFSSINGVSCLMAATMAVMTALRQVRRWTSPPC